MDAPPPIATKPRRSFIDGRFGQMHVRAVTPSRPEYPPLYCIHQSPSSSLVYQSILQSLGVDRIAAAGDSPGFGESDPPADIPEVEDYALAHGEAIDQLGLTSPIDLMGYYTGAKIAVELALQRPKMFRRIILFGAVIYTDEELTGEKHLYRQDKYQWDASHLLGWWKHLKASVVEGYPIDLFVRHFAEIQRGGPNSWWGHRAAFNYDLREKLPQLDQRVLIIRTDDPQGDKSTRALEYLTNGELAHLPFVGQGILDVHTTEVCRVLRRFLDS